MPTLERDAEVPETLGESFGGSLLRYDEHGGTCKRDDCDATAPVVVLLGRQIEMLCPEHSAEEADEIERAERAALAAHLLTESGLTPRMTGFTLDSYGEAFPDAAGMAALAVARRWLHGYEKFGAATNLILFGPLGSGKTGLAAAMVRALCEGGHQAKIVNFGALLEEMKDCYQQKLPTRQALNVGRVRVLVLDDLGSERPTEWACNELLRIVDWRYERGLPTVYVSNFAPDDLIRRLGRDDLIVGQRIVSRMVEGAVQHRIDHPDRRIAA